MRLSSCQRFSSLTSNIDTTVFLRFFPNTKNAQRNTKKDAHKLVGERAVYTGENNNASRSGVRAEKNNFIIMTWSLFTQASSNILKATNDEAHKMISVCKRTHPSNSAMRALFSDCFGEAWEIYLSEINSLSTPAGKNFTPTKPIYLTWACNKVNHGRLIYSKKCKVLMRSERCQKGLKTNLVLLKASSFQADGVHISTVVV